jgi:hypothetical protein
MLKEPKKRDKMKLDTEKLTNLIVDVALILFAIILVVFYSFDIIRAGSMVIVAIALLIRILGYVSKMHREVITP